MRWVSNLASESRDGNLSLGILQRTTWVGEYCCCFNGNTEVGCEYLVGVAKASSVLTKTLQRLHLDIKQRPKSSIMRLLEVNAKLSREIEPGCLALSADINFRSKSHHISG